MNFKTNTPISGDNNAQPVPNQAPSAQPGYTPAPAQNPEPAHARNLNPAYSQQPGHTPNPTHTPQPGYTPNPVQPPQPTYTPNPAQASKPTYPPTAAPQPAYIPAASPAKSNVTPEKSGNSNCSVRMLIMSFLTVMCLTMLPLFQLPIFSGIDVYAPDMARVASFGVQLPDVEEGAMQAHMIALVDESLQTETDPVQREVTIQIRDSILEIINTNEAQILNLISTMQTVSTIIIAVITLTVIAFVILLFAAAKNMKKLYFTINALILAAIAILAIVTISILDCGIGFINYGIWLTMVLLALSCVAPFINFGRKNK